MTHQPAKLDRPHCIIGESDPFMARLIQRFLETLGVDYHMASTGDDVLKLVQEDTAKLVILDPELPGKMRGWQAGKYLSRQTQLDIPIIICTWMEKEEALSLCGQEHAYLQKPDLKFDKFKIILSEAGFQIQ